MQGNIYSAINHIGEGTFYTTIIEKKLAELSESYHVICYNTGGRTTLHLSMKPKLVEIKPVQGEWFQYIELPNQGLQKDVRGIKMDQIEELHYDCGCDTNCSCEFNNLPECPSVKTVYNKGVPISLGYSYQYYRKLKTEFTFANKYVCLNSHGKFNIDYAKYNQDHFSETTPCGYFCGIDAGTVYINSHQTIPLTNGIVNKMLEGRTQKNVVLTLNSLKNAEAEFEEVKKIISPDIRISVRFNI